MQRLTLLQLARHIQESKQSHFTGRLELSTEDGQCWNVFFRLGRLVWATGGIHRFRRWKRVLHQFCADLPHNGIQVGNKEVSLLWEYWVLTIMVKRQWIRREQAVALIEHTIIEVLFDIFQEAHQSPLVIEQLGVQESLGESLVILNAEQLFIKTQMLWKSWDEAKLSECSPNLAPVLGNLEELQQRTSPGAYQTLTKLIDGDSTLRELAVAMKQNLLVLTRSLFPYVNKGLIHFQELPDLIQVKPAESRDRQIIHAYQPLIACIDDSPRVCRLMEQILTSAGFRFVAVQDSLQALTTLLERKPDLVFLDLVMPVASGYEICAQIRRVSALKEIPVVILTGNDGIVDRVRAKIVGASDFLAKPVNASKVLEVIRRQLKTSTKTSETNEGASNSFFQQQTHPQGNY